MMTAVEFITSVYVVGACLTTYGAYHLGYAKGRLFQIDKLVGSITKQDALQLTKALEKLCDYTECVANGEAIRSRAHH